MLKLLLVLAFIPIVVVGQSRKEKKALEVQQKADQVVITSLKNHVQSLANTNPSQQNSLANESRTIDYISTQFKSLGLQPKGTSGFVQPFKVDDGKKIDPSTFVKVNDKQLEVNTDYFPMPYSAEKMVKGKPAMALRERGVPWFFDVKEWFEDGSKMQGNDINDLIKKEATKVAAKGATALFLYNTGTVSDGLAYDKKDKSTPLSIPVIYLTSVGKKKYFNDHSDVLDIELNISFKENIINGDNVIGYIDNAASSSVVIGAHYNHLATSGTKEDLSKNVSSADDYGSGIAMLIELARFLAASKAKNNNYAFIAFGGADRGYMASKYWLQNPVITSPINYMLNLDMVATYTEAKKLAVQGYNSSPIWKEALASIPNKKVDINIDSTETVADSYSSFYVKEIPALSFSSTLREEGLSKSEDEGKIDYAGELQIAKFITRLIEAIDAKGKLAFVKVPVQANPVAKAVEQGGAKPVNNETSNGTSKTTVSLGVVPDKDNSGLGLKISAVTPKKLASKLGLQAGDVITNLGTYAVSDLKSYMQALSNFKSGDKTTLRIKRGKDDKKFPVEF